MDKVIVAAKNQTRRDFIAGTAQFLCPLVMPGLRSPVGMPVAHAASGNDDARYLKEVLFYTKLEEQKIECGICPKKCRIADLERGYCGNKENRGGTYYSLVYSRPCAFHLDPIEKKPLFHYLPGTTAFSIAAAGCNFECRFCQNWRIAQYRPEQIDDMYAPPQHIVDTAAKKQAATIAYTYSEPVVFYGYMLDCARLGRSRGIGSVMISNGFINEKPLRELSKHLTGVKIDLKAFTQSFYREYCSGDLQPVLDTLLVLKDIGIWFEIVVLIIPSLNDGPAEIERMCAWISENLGNSVPLHFSRFHPMYKIRNLPPTPVKTLESCHAIAKENGLQFVYLGNVAGHPLEHTYCPSCGKIIIRRMSYVIIDNHIKDGVCGFCKHSIPGVWSARDVV